MAVCELGATRLGGGLNPRSLHVPGPVMQPQRAPHRFHLHSLLRSTPLRPAGTCSSPEGCDFHEEGETILFEDSEELFGLVFKCWLVLTSCKPVPSTASLCRVLQTSYNRFNPFLSKWGDFMMDFTPPLTLQPHTKKCLVKTIQ